MFELENEADSPIGRNCRLQFQHILDFPSQNRNKEWVKSIIFTRWPIEFFGSKLSSSILITSFVKLRVLLNLASKIKYRGTSQIWGSFDTQAIYHYSYKTHWIELRTHHFLHDLFFSFSFDTIIFWFSFLHYCFIRQFNKLTQSSSSGPAGLLESRLTLTQG